MRNREQVPCLGRVRGPEVAENCDGTPEQLISVQGDEIAHGPEILPDGQSLLMTLTSGNNPDRWDKARIVVQSLTSRERKILIEGGSDARRRGKLCRRSHGAA